MLTPEEKWFFDLTGYIVLPQVVSPEDVQRMLELGDAWHDLPDEQLPPPLWTYCDAHTEPTAARALDNVVYRDEVFQRLVLNPKIMRVVLALTGNRPQLLAASYTKNYKHNDEIPFHNGHDGSLHNPANQYEAKGDKVFATFLNAAVSLVDVPPGAGGFVCVPGSHKSNFACPGNVSLYDEAPIVHNVSVRAGDCVLFTELLRHGGRRWNLDEPRRTIFVRYSTSYASWSPGTGPIPEYRHLLSGDVVELMTMMGHQGCKKAVQRLLDEMETTEE